MYWDARNQGPVYFKLVGSMTYAPAQVLLWGGGPNLDSILRCVGKAW
jgi:hypothetical protein